MERNLLSAGAASSWCDIGADRFSGGYGAAKVAHEQTALAGPLPARILRAAQLDATS